MQAHACLHPQEYSNDVAVPRLLVSRMLARLISRYEAGTLVDSENGATCTDQGLKTRSRTHGCGTSSVACSEKRLGEAQSRLLASEVCRRLLYSCLVTAGVNAHVMAQFLLVHTYRRIGRRRLDGDDLLIPLILRLGTPVEWARCGSCNRHFHALSISNLHLVAYWLSGYSVEGCKRELKFAIQHNIVRILRPLVEAGADVNCVFEQFWFRTPLHRAASRGHAEVCRLLLTLRADANRCDSHGAAPMHLVASKGRVSIVNLLLEADARSAHAMDHSGRTPCHMAALKGHLTIVRLLVAAQANATAQAYDGRTPLDMARRGQHAEVIEYLENQNDLMTRRAEALPAARRVLGALFERALLSNQSSIR